MLREALQRSMQPKIEASVGVISDDGLQRVMGLLYVGGGEDEEGQLHATGGTRAKAPFAPALSVPGPTEPADIAAERLLFANTFHSAAVRAPTSNDV